MLVRIAGAIVQDMKNTLVPHMKRLLAASLPLLLAGCNLTVLDPKGMIAAEEKTLILVATCLLYTSPSTRDRTRSRMPSSA